MQVQIFNTTFGTIDKNQAVSFEGSSEVDVESFFDKLLVNDGYAYEGVSSPNFIKNLWRLYNEITIFDESRIPLNVNYARIKPSASDKWFYFYIYDYEDLGNNQVKYLLKLDTMLTHVFNFPQRGVNFRQQNQLVLREHKDRFTAVGVPIYNKTLEDVDVKPSILGTNWTESDAVSRKLVLKKYGGTVVGNEVLSQPMYAYDVHGDTTVGNAVDDLEFNMPVGWGIRTPLISTVDNWIYFIWSSTEYDTTTIAILNKEREFRFVKSEDGNHYLQLMSGVNLATGIGITGVGAEVVSGNADIRLKGNGKLTLFIINEPETTTVHIEKDLGMEPTSAFHNRPDKVFATYNYLDNFIRPFRESSIDYSNSTNQKVIEIPKGFNFNKYTLKTGNFGAIIPLNTDLGIKNINVPMTTKTFDTTFSNIKARVPLNDPKLYHSQYRPRYLSYLSESLLLRRESLNNTFFSINFNYKVNDSDYSKLLLYSNVANDVYEKNELYELSKIIDLNNEVALIKDDFSQYLDSNYRSDQRLQELQIARANRDLISSSVNQVVGIGAGIAGGAIAGNVVGATIGGVTGTVRAVTNIVNGVKNLNQMKEELKLNYNQKIKSLQYSLINITGATPEFNELIDSNRMKLFEFRPTNEELNYLDNYFHMYGYNTLEYKIPNLKTRYYFNFIQMELINYNVADNMITTEVLDDIKERFRKGLTILHANMINGEIIIDGFLYYENYERVLIP